MAPPKVDTSSLSRGSLRGLVRLLALLLVPVVVIAMPYSAQAATKVSGQKTVTFGSKSWVPQQWVTCSVQAWYVVTGTAAAGYTQSLKTNSGDCDTGTGLNYEGGALAMTWTGLTGAGDPCSGGVSDVILGTDEVIPNTSAVMTFLGQPVAASGLCTVTQMCWTLTNSWAGVDWADDGCEPVTMGAPAIPTEGSTETCPTATMTGGNLQEWQGDTRTPKRWEAVYKLKDVTGGQWNFGVILSTSTAGVYTYLTLADPVALSPGQVTFTAGALDPVTEKPKVQGLFMINTAAVYSDAASVHRNHPYTSWAGRGVQDPGQCRFYFGEKFWDDGNPATTYDSPGGPADGTEVPSASNDPDPAPVAPAPEVKDDACAFSWTDPTTFMCAMGSLFRGLFIPDQGYLNGRVQTTKSKLNQTTPGRYLDAVQGLVPGSVSGCAGMPFRFQMRGEVYVDDHIGAACSGKMADVAALVRLAISAAVVIGGGLACVRALGSGFGWNPGIGRGESA